MLARHIQVPYIKTLFGLATPALIISVIYLFTLVVFLYCAKKKDLIRIGIIDISRLMQGDKNKIILSLIGYFVFIFSCINLPKFLGEENILLKISETYLTFEPLVFMLLFVFLCTSFFNNTNRETHIKAANCIFCYLIWVSLGAGILFGQIDFAYWKNMVVIVCAWVLNGLFFVIDIRPIQKDAYNSERFDLIPYGAVKSADDLFPSHKKQAEDIVNIISTSSPEPFSVCLSGEWGSGKTSVINGVVALLGEKEDNPYDIIYINALELDDKKTVLKYLMTQIREKLKSRGVYVGINSEYKEFVSSFAGSLTSSAIGTFLQKKLANDEDYRAQKKKLEEVLERTYKNGKLIVMVDDIERCDKNIAREYLFLIKEVATMKSCISVFVTDYDMLNKIVSDENTSKESYDFLNKFFNYKIDLIDEAPENIFSFYDSFFDQRDPAFDSIYRIICKSPGTWYDEAVAGLTSKLNELNKDSERYHLKKEEERKPFEKRVEDQKECLSLFIKLMQNPRNVAKFYNVYRNHALYCERHLRLASNSVEASKYIESRNIGQALYLISFAEVFLPSEYEQLKSQGAQYIDPPLYAIGTIPNEKSRLLIGLAQGLIFREYSEFKKLDGYIRVDIKNFIESFLSRNSELHQLINPFTSQEEEWLNAISASKYQVIEKHWEEMIMMVLQKVPNENAGITTAWRNETFLFLLEFAETQVKTGAWTSDKLFSIFDSDLHIDRYWSLGTGLMQTFWAHVEKSTSYTRPAKERVDDFYAFVSHYAYARSSTIYKLLHYLIPLNNNAVKTDNIREYLINSNNSLSQNLTNFLKEIEAAIPNFSFSSEGCYDNLKELTKKINDYLVSHGVAEYSDMREDIVHMLDTAEEFQCLEKVAAWIAGEENTGFQISVLGDHIENIDELIAFFEKGFNELPSNTEARHEFDKKFTDFFRAIQQRDTLTLTKIQSNRLHQLVERFAEEFTVSSLPYRRIILNIAEKE